MKFNNRLILHLLVFTQSLLVFSQNCSFNGTWNGGSCECYSAWTGLECNILRVLPAEPNTGYRPENTDSWGASILIDDDGIYHMWVSIIDNNCDIQYWARNSKVIHATSSNPEGPYTYQEDAFPVMTHEVDVKRGPEGNWIAFLTAGIDEDGRLGYSSYGPPCECDPETQQPYEDCDFGASTEPTVILTATSPYGPWSDPIVILEPETLDDGIDANFSAVVHDDSTLFGLWRTYPKGSQVHWVTASDYLDPSSYSWQEQGTSLFPAPYDGYTSEGLEDMFVYYDDTEDVYHAILHDMVAQRGALFYDGLGHAYSNDGINWTYTGEAIGTEINFTDSTKANSSRARPHFIIEDGQITHLISAEQFDDNDWSYTVIEPVGKSNPIGLESHRSQNKIINIFPNPSKGILLVNSTSQIDQINIYNLLGRKIESFEVNAEYIYEIDLNVKGVFILEIQTDNGVILEKVTLK